MKQNGMVCWPGHSLFFFIFRFEYLISGPKSYRDFRETGPRAHHVPPEQNPNLEGTIEVLCAILSLPQLGYVCTF